MFHIEQEDALHDAFSYFIPEELQQTGGQKETCQQIENKSASDVIFIKKTLDTKSRCGPKVIRKIIHVNPQLTC